MADIPTGSFEHDLEEIDAAVSEVESTKGTETSLTAAIEEIAGTSATTAAQSAVSTAIGALDASSKGGSGKYIKSISETDGVISATAETMDAAPTAESDKAVKSGGVKTYVDTAVNILADAGRKNMFKITASTTLTNGVRFTVNSDGTVTVNRESSSSSNAIFTMARLQDIGLYGSNLIMSGCPSGGSSSTYRMQLFISNEISNVSDYGNGATININQADTIQTSNISIIISSSYSPNNMVFKPMVRHSEITDATYQPYAPTNRELYEMILAMQ